MDFVNVTQIKIRKSILYLTLQSSKSLPLEELSLVYCTSTDKIAYPVSCSVTKQDKCQLIQAQLDTKTITFQEGDWELQAKCSTDKGGMTLPVVLDSKTRIRLILGNYQIKFGKQHILFPLSGSQHKLIFRYRVKTPYDGYFTHFKEYLVFAIYKLGKPLWKRQKIWLVYEKYSSAAQENGYYFFKYCMENLDESRKKQIFYILDKQSPDWKKMQAYGKHVIPFMSFRHMLYTLTANIYIAPEARVHAYIWKPKPNLISREMNKKKIFFLQHGVLALKRVENLFGKTSGNAVTYFTASSPMEQQIIVENFGYTPEEAPILGLTRWDVLEDHSSENDRFILVMPTWRSWLEDQSDETFCKSDYYLKYMHLIQNQELLNYLETHHIRLVFHIHPKLKAFMKTFHTDNKNVELISYGSTPLNELLMKCSMLITDYSSVCWDMFYQEKPILFYQFDLDLYEKTNGSYIDMEKELFGDRYLNETDLAEGIKEYVKNDFHEKERYAQMRETYLPYRDHNNSKRTYEFIINKGY